ncbi:MAG TPA: putative lipid II flippase FtsW [Desulfitobacteriaceae bacterium]|nr:putative lipid II flippase FtsW [Desulfitobacteriaceae bacterium]
MSRKRVPGSKRAAPLRKPDFLLFFLILALLAFGLIMVLSAGAIKSFNFTNNTNAYYYALQQLKWALVGGVLAYITTRIPYTYWRRFAGPAMVVSLILLFAVLFSKAGVEAKGSARWLNIAGLVFQPSELVKLTLILFYAKFLDRYPVRTIRDLYLPGGLLVIVLALVYKQPDLGTTMVLGLTAMALLLQTELPTKWFAMAVPLALGSLYLLVRSTEYQWQRVLVWLNPWKYVSNQGYQIVNAEIAFGTGGLFGVGLGRSLQKYGFLPENYTDTIFAIVGEEFGLLGTTIMVALFVGLFARCYKIVGECPDRFGRLLGYGITSSLAIQTTINLAVVTGVMPLTGITLPLISYGGTSLSVTMAELGILLNISRYRQPRVVPNSPEIQKDDNAKQQKARRRRSLSPSRTR